MIITKLFTTFINLHTHLASNMRIYSEDYYEDLLFIFKVKLKSLKKSFLRKIHNKKERVSNSVWKPCIIYKAGISNYNNKIL